MGGMQLAANGWWWMVDDGCTAIIRLPISIGVRKHLCMVLLPGARVSMELDILASASQSKGESNGQIRAVEQNDHDGPGDESVCTVNEVPANK
ncbi:hypothetical protein TgHK011_003736 [Trichoderma gracile]|nr:hypothetical protein TgHK011_003736 [Trichoderma gracile]